MRVIGGTLGGRKFHPPSNLPTRPTTDFAKTGLFNILNNHLDFSEISFLDLFSGTGNLSYEMASRNCSRIVSIDMDSRCIDFIKRMRHDWNLDTIDIIKMDVFKFLEQNTESFDCVFAGPPYPLPTIDELPTYVLDGQLLNPGGWFILETSPKHDYSSNKKLWQMRKYGQTRFHIFKNT